MGAFKRIATVLSESGWLDRHIAEQAEQAAVVFAAPEVAEYTEADEVADAEETPCRRCERRLLADPKCEYCVHYR